MYIKVILPASIGIHPYTCPHFSGVRLLVARQILPSAEALESDHQTFALNNPVASLSTATAAHQRQRKFAVVERAALPPAGTPLSLMNGNSLRGPLSSWGSGKGMKLDQSPARSPSPATAVGHHVKCGRDDILPAGTLTAPPAVSENNIMGDDDDIRAAASPFHSLHGCGGDSLGLRRGGERFSEPSGALLCPPPGKATVLQSRVVGFALLDPMYRDGKV